VIVIDAVGRQSSSPSLPLLLSDAIPFVTCPYLWQGYMWKRSSSHKMMQHWNRRWFVLDQAKMFYLKEGGDVEEPYGMHVRQPCTLDTLTR